jgi:hypothetical protein
MNESSGTGIPLFYTKPEVLDPERHRGLALKHEIPYSFARQVNAIPLNAVEIPAAAEFYPVAFAPAPQSTPVAIVGLRDDENLFVSGSGEWLSGAYIPAYCRRYPFIFARGERAAELLLAVDVTDLGTEIGGDRRFFDEAGEPTETTRNALEFCKQYQEAAQATEAFGRALDDLGLLIDKEVDIEIPRLHRRRFSGIRIVDEKEVDALDGDLFLELRARGYLGLIYAHLFSGSRWDGLAGLLAQRLTVGGGSERGQ